MSDEVVKKPGRPPAVKAETDGPSLVEAQIKALQLQLMSLTGRHEAPQQVIEKAKVIVNRLYERKKNGGKNHWRVHNSRYKTSSGDPVAHDFWSDAVKPEAARADYNERNERYWSPDEGADPLKFELVQSE